MAKLLKMHEFRITREQALKTRCDELYIAFEKMHNLSYDLTVQDCIVAADASDGFLYSKQVMNIPRSKETLGSVFPYTNFFISAKVKTLFEGLDPNTRMTRGEFVIEVLDLIDNFRKTLNPYMDRIAGVELDITRKWLLGCYSTGQLMDIHELEALING